MQSTKPVPLCTVILLFVLAIGGIACGLFAPRPVENPMDTVSDPLKFAAVLKNTGCFFRSNAYADIFSDQLIYDNNGYQPKTTSKSTLVQRLNEIVSDNPTLTIQWKDDARYLTTVKGDTGYIYQVYSIQPQGANSSGADSGSSEFRVVRNPGANTWVIQSWRDESLTPLSRSIFNPERK